MRPGLFQAEDQARLAKAIVQEQENRDKASVDSHLAGTARVDLRRNAVKARQEYKKAVKIQAKVQHFGDITPHERELLCRFNDGTLAQRREAANNAYGHGKDVSTFSKEEAIVMKAFEEAPPSDDRW